MIWKSLWDVSCCLASPCQFRVIIKLLSPTSEPASSCATVQSVMHIMTGSFLTARAVFILQGNALCKAIVPCSVSTDEAGLCVWGESSQELPSPCETQAFFQLPGFSRAPTLLHKTRLSLSDFHLVTEMWFIFSQLLSFLLIFPSQPQNTNPVLAQQPPKTDLQTEHPNYCRTAKISPSWWTAWRERRKIEGK